MNDGLIDRMKGAAMLDVDTYEAVEHDTTATRDAAIVVAIGAVAQFIGGGHGDAGSLIGAVIGALIGWAIWAGITYFIGARLFEGTATWGELLRTLGFAQAPAVLTVIAFIPLLGWIVRAVVGIWILIAGVVAVRQALDFGTGRAIATVVVGWLAIAIPTAIMAILF